MLQAAIGEGQQRGVQWALGVLQDGIVLVDVLYHLRVELILLKYTSGEKNSVDNTSRHSNKNKLSHAFKRPAANLEASQ